jgi:hypothetical protein
MLQFNWKSWLSSSTPKIKKPARKSAGPMNAQLQFNTLESRVVPSGGGCQAFQGSQWGQFGGCQGFSDQGCGGQTHQGQNFQCGGNGFGFQWGGFECGHGQSNQGGGCGHSQGGGGGGGGGGPTQSAPVTISGVVYGDNNATGQYNTSDVGLAGSTVTLTGTNNLGQAVSVTVTSQANGAYSFTGVLPGTYTISYTPVSGYATEAANDAPTGAVAAPGAISNVVVTSGNNVTVNLPESPTPTAQS